MQISIGTFMPDRLVACLRDGAVETTVSGCSPREAGAALSDAIETAQRDGFGQCHWFEATGQYWWIVRHDSGETEVVVLWSSGAATGWQHVFRATDDGGSLGRQVLDQLAPYRFESRAS